jgi:PAS domain-containing protein
VERREQFALSCGTPAFVLTEGTPPWTTTGIQDLIGAIYEAPLEPQQWTYVVSRLKSETRSRLGHLFAGTVHDTLEDFTSPDRYLGYDSDTLPLADLESFGRHMRDSTINDPRRLRFSPALHAKKAFFSWEVMPLDEFKRSAFYNEFGQGMDSFGGLIAATTGRGGNFIHLAFHRSESDPLFDENDKRLLSVFLPHIWRSLDVHQRLLTANTQSSLLRNSFDALQSAIVLLKQDGKVIFLNRAAEELIERCAELYLCRDRLCAVNHADHLKLDRLIKTVTGGAGRQRLGEGMTIRRETGHSLQIISAPVPTDSQATLMAGLGRSPCS